MKEIAIILENFTYKSPFVSLCFNGLIQACPYIPSFSVSKYFSILPTGKAELEKQPNVHPSDVICKQKLSCLACS